MRRTTLPPLPLNAWLRHDALRSILPPPSAIPGGDVLEIGCGQGSIGARLARDHAYLGLEPDATSAAIARSRLADEALDGEVRSILPADLDPGRRFGLVCAFEVLEHLEDDVAAVSEWVQRVRPGGWLVLSVPADPQSYGPFDLHVGHWRRYEPERLGELLQDAGLADITVRRYGWPLGRLLEAARNTVARRRGVTDEDAAALAAGATTTSDRVELHRRTESSGRVLQPTSLPAAYLARLATAPFRLVSQAVPQRGVALVARAQLPGSDHARDTTAELGRSGG